VTRLLILSCTRRKRDDPGQLPALERYDGPAFRVLRRYRRLVNDESLVVYVLSAEFGLIAASTPIPSYDRLMTRERANELRPLVSAALSSAVKQYAPSLDIFVVAGRTYMRALADLPKDFGRISFATGGQGGKLASLKAWLNERTV
jgi:hypothetical protein